MNIVVFLFTLASYLATSFPLIAQEQGPGLDRRLNFGEPKLQRQRGGRRICHTVSATVNPLKREFIDRKKKLDFAIIPDLSSSMTDYREKVAGALAPLITSLVTDHGFDLNLIFVAPLMDTELNPSIPNPQGFSFNPYYKKNVFKISRNASPSEVKTFADIVRHNSRTYGPDLLKKLQKAVPNLTYKQRPEAESPYRALYRLLEDSSVRELSRKGFFQSEYFSVLIITDAGANGDYSMPGGKGGRYWAKKAARRLLKLREATGRLEKTCAVSVLGGQKTGHLLFNRILNERSELIDQGHSRASVKDSDYKLKVRFRKLANRIARDLKTIRPLRFTYEFPKSPSANLKLRPETLKLTFARKEIPGGIQSTSGNVARFSIAPQYLKSLQGKNAKAQQVFLRYCYEDQRKRSSGYRPIKIRTKRCRRKKKGPPVRCWPGRARSKKVRRR